MRFNRAISPVKVLSFDLDDTLYDNHPIIISAIKAQQDYLASIDKWQAQPGDYWLTCRSEYARLFPEVIDDVTVWRQKALRWGFEQLGIENSDHHAVQAYQAFAKARSNITVDQDVIDLLTQLRTKYKVIAITNGNVDVSQFNLKDSFDLVLQAGPNGKAKPQPDMFITAADTLGVALSEILHIGDSLDSDVQGANLAGCKSVWLENSFSKYQYKGLADIEITDIFALKNLF
jgi:putative hydrolase of the HAD superfamily